MSLHFTKKMDPQRKTIVADLIVAKLDRIPQQQTKMNFFNISNRTKLNHLVFSL
jgi:hypothetical protein